MISARVLYECVVSAWVLHECVVSARVLYECVLSARVLYECVVSDWVLCKYVVSVWVMWECESAVASSLKLTNLYNVAKKSVDVAKICPKLLCCESYHHLELRSNLQFANYWSTTDFEDSCQAIHQLFVAISWRLFPLIYFLFIKLWSKKKHTKQKEIHVK